MIVKWPSFDSWRNAPEPQYIPQADIVFPATGPVMPSPLPPTSMQFRGAQFNKMNNIPMSAVPQIYSTPRYGRQL